MTTFNVGDRVTRAGYEGVVRFVHTGALSGMVDVRLPGGLVTVPASDLESA